ncbi:hypothetical protein [Photobacterium nomapromontoriensis]|uniref:hypothetical protein n=1 Tax=Photobacterium nomapromontoriensis TaxID=2910237 RepID=UPI003D1333AE
MGLFSYCCDAVSRVVSSACSAISNTVSKVGSWVVDTATAIVKLGVELATKVSDTIKAVGVLLNIIRGDEQMEELGEKALVSDKKPEDFDSFNDYINHLRHDVQIDEEKLSQLDEKDRLVRSAIGASIILKGINEILGVTVTPEFMAAVASQELDAAAIINTIKAYKENGLETGDYSLYLNDELSLDESGKHSHALVEAYQKLEPELSIEQIEDKVMDLKG